MDTANYAESAIAGTSWKRVSRVQIDNPRNAAPSLMFVKDKVINMGDSEISTPVANLSCQFDPSDPDDMAIYDLLNRKYIKLREARDAALLS